MKWKYGMKKYGDETNFILLSGEVNMAGRTIH